MVDEIETLSGKINAMFMAQSCPKTGGYAQSQGRRGKSLGKIGVAAELCREQWQADKANLIDKKFRTAHNRRIAARPSGTRQI
jgi:hypothetical protein